MRRNPREGRMMASLLGVAVATVLIVSGLAMAGAFMEVWVDGAKTHNGSSCNLFNDVEVNGTYMPDNPYDAVIRWKLDGGSWHIAYSWGGANGAVGFLFNMNEDTTGSSTLYLWGDESRGVDGYWSRYET